VLAAAQEAYSSVEEERNEARATTEMLEHRTRARIEELERHNEELQQNTPVSSCLSYGVLYSGYLARSDRLREAGGYFSPE